MILMMMMIWITIVVFNKKINEFNLHASKNIDGLDHFLADVLDEALHKKREETF